MNVAEKRPLPCPSDWTFELIEEYDTEIARVAQRYGLDTYPIQLEIISAEQMMDAYASVGMPVNYRHWSFGKQFMSTEKSYKRGQMGWPTRSSSTPNPCIAYLMEENTMTMQALVIAHAAYGHNSSSRATTCSGCGRTRTPSSITWCTRRTTSPNARSARARRGWRNCSIPATR
jgi:stage V sporulation protein R